LFSIIAVVLFLDHDDDGSKSHKMDNLSLDVTKVYAPPDPFATTTSPFQNDNSASQRIRQITARVPLKEMVGYLKHLRSLTGGRGTFVMQFDRFEPVRGQRLKRAMTSLRGS